MRVTNSLKIVVATIFLILLVRGYRD